MSESLQMRIAFLMPRWLVYFCSVRLMANATQGAYSNESVSDLRAMDALQRWRQN